MIFFPLMSQVTINYGNCGGIKREDDCSLFYHVENSVTAVYLYYRYI